MRIRKSVIMMCGSRSCSVSRSVSLGSNVNSLAMLVVIVMMTLYEAILYDTTVGSQNGYRYLNVYDVI